MFLLEGIQLIEITKNPNRDTRTAPKGITFEEFQEANTMHIENVKAVMWEIAKMIDRTGENHDCTKKSQERMFYRDFVNTQETGAEFKTGEWYQLHVKAERHHLFANCPDDVNLIDVLEMITDCVCAGLSRSGEVRDMEINADILNRAVQNTVELVKDMIVVNE